MAKLGLLIARCFVTVIIALAVTLPNPLSARADGQCSDLQAQTSGCPTVGGSIGNGGVDLDGSVTRPGTPGGSTAGGTGGVSSGSGTGRGANSGSVSSGSGTGGGANTGGNATPASPTASTPTRDGYSVSRPGDPNYPVSPVTLRDLVNFRPVAGVDHMEPNGWMVVGLHTNFFATTGVQVQDGLLLNQPASVRFTPVRYHWNYGDGSSARLATPGGTWASQGIQEFDPTPTSHVYTTAGTYNIDLTIDFSAAYRFADGPWTEITGTIPVPANRLVASAGDAKTVLVERDCTVNPSGPGC